MAEEHGFQSQEGHRLCVNNCGFFGSPATQNMCSKCYRDLHLKHSGDPSIFSKPSASTASTASSSAAEHPIESAISAPGKAEAPVPPPQGAGRCSACRKRVGLTGFMCRCGATFCGVHRYPEKHRCGFDFKSEGREAIARANPLIKADKLEKI